jgi:C1A family cysteine protease
MFEPTRCGELVAKNGVAGGHAMAMVAVDMKNMKFIIRNSWGNSWGKCRTRNGVKECGYAYFSAGTFQKLMDEGAEVICSVP